MFRLQPPSSTARRSRGDGGSWATQASVQPTSVARARPAIPGHRCSCSASAASSVPSVLIAHRMAPWSRRWRTRARVSTPCMPGTPPWTRYWWSPPVDRHDDGPRVNDRTT